MSAKPCFVCKSMEAYANCCVCEQYLCGEHFPEHMKALQHQIYVFSTPNLPELMKVPACQYCFKRDYAALFHVRDNPAVMLLCGQCSNAGRLLPAKTFMKDPLLTVGQSIYFGQNLPSMVLVSPTSVRVSSALLIARMKLLPTVRIEQLAMNCRRLVNVRPEDMKQFQGIEKVPYDLDVKRSQRMIQLVTERAYQEFNRDRIYQNGHLLIQAIGLSSTTVQRITNEAYTADVKKLIAHLIAMRTAVDTNVMEQAIYDKYLKAFNYGCSTCNDICQELKLFCCGPPGSIEPLPIYQLREELMSDKVSFGGIKSASGTGKTALVPFILAQQGTIKFTFITEPNDDKIDQVYKMMMATAAEDVIITRTVDAVISNHQNAPLQKVFVICTALVLVKFMIQHMDMMPHIRVVMDDFHERTADFDVLFSVITRNMQQFTKSYQMVLMSATPNQVIIKILPHVKLLEINDKPKHNVVKNEVIIDNILQALVLKPAELLVQTIEQMQNKILKKGNVLVFAHSYKSCGDIINILDNKYQQAGNIKITAVKNMLKAYDRNNAIVDEVKQKIIDNPQQTFVVIANLCNDADALERQIVERFEKCDCIIVYLVLKISESVNLPNLAVLIDSGVYQQEQFSERYGIQCSKLRLVTQSESEHRVSRIGQFQDGITYSIRVTEENRVQELSPICEIRRFDLSKFVLDLKEIGVNVETLLNNLPTPPVSSAIQTSVSFLKNIQAIANDNQITDFGCKISSFKHFNTIQSLTIITLTSKFQHGNAFAAILMFSIGKFNFLNTLTSYLCTETYCSESDIVTMIQTFFRVYEVDITKQAACCRQNDIIYTNFLAICRAIQDSYMTINNLQFDDEDKRIQLERDIRISIIGQYKRLKPLLLSAIDEVIKYHVFFVEKFTPQHIFKKTATFLTITNTKESPKYLFQSNTEQYITAEQRPGTTNFDCHKQVYILDVYQHNENMIFMGRLIHRLPHPLNFQKCFSVRCIQNIVNLVFLEHIFNIYFANSILNVIYSEGYRQSANRNSYLFSQENQQTLTFCLKKQLNTKDQNDFNDKVNKLIEMAANTPQTLLKVVKTESGVNTIAEFYTDDSGHNVRYFKDDDIKAPKVYKLNQQAINTLISQQNIRRTISLTISENMRFNDILIPDSATSAFYSENGVLLGQLVIILDDREKDIKNLTKLKWKDQDEKDDNQLQLRQIQPKNMTQIQLRHECDEVVTLLNKTCGEITAKPKIYSNEIQCPISIDYGELFKWIEHSNTIPVQIKILIGDNNAQLNDNDLDQFIKEVGVPPESVRVSNRYGVVYCQIPIKQTKTCIQQASSYIGEFQYIHHIIKVLLYLPAFNPQMRTQMRLLIGHFGVLVQESATLQTNQDYQYINLRGIKAAKMFTDEVCGILRISPNSIITSNIPIRVSQQTLTISAINDLIQGNASYKDLIRFNGTHFIGSENLARKFQEEVLNSQFQPPFAEILYQAPQVLVKQLASDSVINYPDDGVLIVKNDQNIVNAIKTRLEKAIDGCDQALRSQRCAHHTLVSELIPLWDGRQFQFKWLCPKCVHNWCCNFKGGFVLNQNVAKENVAQLVAQLIRSREFKEDAFVMLDQIQVMKGGDKIHLDQKGKDVVMSVKSGGYKGCPQCGAKVIVLGGNMSIKCQCGCNWCWVCGEKEAEKHAHDM